MDAARVPEDLEDAGEQAAGRVVLERHIQVGERDREPDHLARALGKADELRYDDRLQLFREVVDLRVRQRAEAPVLLPRLVVEALNKLPFPGDPLTVGRPKGDAPAP